MHVPPSAESALSATHTHSHTQWHTHTHTHTVELLTRFATFAAELMWLWFSGCHVATLSIARATATEESREGSGVAGEQATGTQIGGVRSLVLRLSLC